MKSLPIPVPKFIASVVLAGCCLPFSLQAEDAQLTAQAASAVQITGDAGAPSISSANAVGETIPTRARDFASGAVRGYLDYIRFDMSSLGGIVILSAELRLNKVSGDTLVTGRFASFGMDNVAGNSPQDWNTTSFTPGAEADFSMFYDNAASSGVSPVNLANVTDLSEEESIISGTTAVINSQTLVDFLQARADDGGLATFLLAMPSQGGSTDRSINYASQNHPDAGLHPTLSLTYYDSSLPPPPENLRVVGIDFSADPVLHLEWDPTPDALQYKVYRRAEGETEASLVDTVNSTMYMDTDVELLATYFYSVSVVGTGGDSIPSNELEVTIADFSQDVPDVPSGIMTTTAEPDQIGLAWDPSAGALLYEIYRSTSPDRDYELVGTSGSPAFLDTWNVEGFQTYYYSLAAIGAGGMSAFSPAHMVGPRFVEDGIIPKKPKHLQVVNRELYTIHLQWEGSEEAEAFYVYRSTNPKSGFQLVKVVEENEVLDDYAIYPTQAYAYQVYAVGTGGFSHVSVTLEAPAVLTQKREMEHLARAPVAVDTGSGIFVSWRLLGTDPFDTKFNLFRDGKKVNPHLITGATNYLDPDGNAESQYRVQAVGAGDDPAFTDAVGVLPMNYLSVPLQRPEGGTTPDGVNYTYSPNDASVADLDGDSEYEIVLKWDPSNSQDNANAGYTGNVYLDAYEMDGTHLWRIDLGRNIRAGAHYTQFMVYDLDGDGRAELVCKTADGTVDGAGTVIGDASADWRNGAGYILEGPEFLTVFDGQTGAIIDTIDYVPQRGNVLDWGDSYGNRVDRFLAGIAYFDGIHPSYFACRGQYRGQGGTDGRTVIAAFDLVDGQLMERWVLDSWEDGREWAGQGHHQLSVGDADGDGNDEIMYGGMVVDDDGTGLYSTELGTGDALHFGDLDPTRPGLEFFAVKEESTQPIQVEYRDPATGELIWGWFNGRDTGRGLTADIDPTYAGAEVWGAANLNVWNARGDLIGIRRPSINFATWWDGDPIRELTDGNSVRKWDYVNEQEVPIMVAGDCASNNGTKATPCLQADILGDWREEVMFRTEDNTELRIFTTTDLTDLRITTLMHDPMYRLAVAWQNNGYNQPPHPSFFIGNNMPTPPRPNLTVIKADAEE